MQKLYVLESCLTQVEVQRMRGRCLSRRRVVLLKHSQLASLEELEEPATVSRMKTLHHSLAHLQHVAQHTQDTVEAFVFLYTKTLGFP